MNRGVFKKILSVALLLAACTVPCHAAQDRQTVRVAYFDMGDYYTQDANGKVQSYDCEMLGRLEHYCKLSFEYVDCGTWANALIMLNNHQVDLVGTMQWTREREEEYEFCLQSYGYTVGELAALPTSDLVYEDYDAMNNTVVGCMSGYVRKKELNAVFRRHQISPTIKTYETQRELEEALENREIDIAAANSHAMPNEWNVVEKFYSAPFYFVSWKGNEQLTDQIDSALIELNLRAPEADDALLLKYCPDILGEPLTKKELDLIAKGKTYMIYYSTDVKPLAWYDEETNHMQGALVDACKQITDITGLKLEVRPLWEAPKQELPTTIRYTTLFYNSAADISGDTGVTDALLTEGFNLYHRIDKNVDVNKNKYSIAIVSNRNMMEEYIADTYPNCEIVHCASPSDCIRRLESGRVDLAYLDIHVAENVLMETGINDIRELPMDAVAHGMGMLFEGENKDILASIVNKGIQKLDSSEISNAMVQYALSTHKTMSWRIILRDYVGWLILGMVLVIGVLMALVSLVTYANVMRKQRDKVEQADADRAEFFSRMSHDMRTPMNGILGMIRLTEESSDVSEMHENMDKAQAAGEYMLSLINDTLDLQRLESKRMKLNPEIVYAADYFDDVFSMMKISAKQKNVEFRVTNVSMELNKYVEIDKIRVKQIFSNLLSNAIKFTPAGGTVEVIMECLGQEGDLSHKKFCIRDTGVGMSADFIQNRLFKPYSQENNELTSQLTGTGLGLAITKNLVEIMGGRLEVESEPGEGTTFTLYLDFRNVPDEIAATEEQKKRNSASVVQSNLVGKRILLCEDHPLNAEIAKRLLEKVGCEVTWAQNGQQGLDCFAQSQQGYFDVILMDIRMPVMDGFTAAGSIRSLERTDAKTVPMIAMTANAYDADVKCSLDVGMNAHLAKPVDPDKMYTTIAACLHATES